MNYPITVCAVDVGATKVAAGLVKFNSPDEKPEVVERHSVPTEAETGCEGLLGRISVLIALLIAKSSDPVSAIGVGTTGRVSAADGVISASNDLMPGWCGQPVGPYLHEYFGIPVAVYNDVQAWALGEARWGAARGAQNAIVTAIGTGLGGAIICDGKLQRGARGFAGELGHTFHPAAANIRCACGGTSHLESVASGSGIEACYERKTGNKLTGVEISQLAAEGDDTARQVIYEAGRALGESIATWTNMLDPEVVVVGGSVANAGPIWDEALREGYERESEGIERDVQIKRSELGNDAPLIGAAEAAMDLLRN